MAHPLHGDADMASKVLERVAVPVFFLSLMAANPVAAVTPGELSALAKAGLGDEVLIALIETSGVPEEIDANGALELRRSGVSDRVIAAAVRASRPPAPTPDPTQVLDCGNCYEIPVVSTPPAVPTPPVIEREVYREVYYFVPVAVGPPVRPPRDRQPKPYLSGDRGTGRFINDGVTLPRDRRADPRR